MSSELSQAGIKGMRWGVRKNEDGKREGTPTKGTEKAKHKPSADHLRTAAIRKKKLSEMSNEELKDASKRLQLEKTYKELTNKPSLLARGEARLNRALRVVNTVDNVARVANGPTATAVRNTPGGKAAEKYIREGLANAVRIAQERRGS